MENFLNKLKGTSTKEELIDFCRKSVLHGTPNIFKDGEDESYEFKKENSQKI